MSTLLHFIYLLQFSAISFVFWKIEQSDTAAVVKHQ